MLANLHHCAKHCIRATGHDVHCRFGGPGGAFYPAVVLRVRWLDDDGDAASIGDTDAAPHFDLKYDQDGHQVSSATSCNSS
jgi:hypothetical protein